MPRDHLDPLPGACFNCRRRGHSRAAYHEPRTNFCYNYGRQETTLRDCPRCGEVHQEYVREQERRVETPSRESLRPPRRRQPSPPSTTQRRANRWDQPSTSHPSISSRTESAAIQSPPTSRPATTGHTETPAKLPTSRKRRRDQTRTRGTQETAMPARHHPLPGSPLPGSPLPGRCWRRTSPQSATCLEIARRRC